MGFDVAEYSKKRKEEEQKKYRLSAEDETSGFDVAEYSKSRNASSVLENLQKKLKTWSEQSNNLVNNYNSRYIA